MSKDIKKWYEDWKYGINAQGNIEVEIPYTMKPTHLVIRNPSSEIVELGTLLMCALYDLTERDKK